MIVIKCFMNGKYDGYLSDLVYYKTDFDKPKVFFDLNHAYDVINSILDRTDFDENDVTYEIIGVELVPTKRHIPKFNWLTPKEDRVFKEEIIKE